MTYFASGVLEKDIQAWRKAVSTAKLQAEYQSNRVMNLEVVEANGSSVWLHSNSCAEGCSLLYTTPQDLSDILPC
jgi:Ni,Fe-hydrogenase I small subunit